MSGRIAVLIVAVGLAVSCAKQPQSPGTATGATGSGSAAADLAALSKPIAGSSPSTPPPATTSDAAGSTTPQPGSGPAKTVPAPTTTPPPQSKTATGTAGKSVQPGTTTTPQAKTPPPAPAPAYTEVTIGAGTSLHVKLGSALASDKSKPEERIEGSLADAVVVNGVTALPAGAEVMGVVQSVEKPGRIRGKGKIVVQITGVRAWSETFDIDARFEAEAGSSSSDDVKAGAGGGAAGAVVGAVTGGKKGAVIGGVAGAAAGVMLTRGRDVEIPAGARIAAILRSAVTLRVPKK